MLLLYHTSNLIGKLAYVVAMPTDNMVQNEYSLQTKLFLLVSQNPVETFNAETWRLRYGYVSVFSQHVVHSGPLKAAVAANQSVANVCRYLDVQ